MVGADADVIGKQRSGARKLAVIMHAMWTDGTFYAGDTHEAPTDRALKAKAKHKRLLGAHA